MRGILYICVTCGLLLASVGATTTDPAPTDGTMETSKPTAPDANTAITPSNAPTDQNVTTPPGSSGNTTDEATTSLSTQESSSSNVTEATGIPNVTTPRINITEAAVTTTTANPTTCSSNPNPCGNVSCIQLSNDFVCRCSPGFSFSNSSCHPGDTFYGLLTITGKEFSPDPASAQYTAIYRDVISNFKKCFENFPDYLSTTVLEMSQSTTKNARNTSPVDVKVSHIFGPGTTDKATVDQTIIDYVKTIDSFAAYADQTICSSGVYCDGTTTTCTADSSGQSAVCTCNGGLYSSQLTVTTCRECAPDCTSSAGRQCKQGGDNNLPQCVCLPGYKSKDNQCTKCDFGYSGDDCKDNYLLILVIVGAVLGAAVLALLGAVIGVSVRSSKSKSGERAELIDDDKPERSSPAPGSLFPKVQVRSDMGQVNRASNMYDNNEEQYNRSIPKRDYDENPWYEMARKDRNY